MFKYFTGRYAQAVTGYTKKVQDPWLRRVVENLFLPEAPVWFILMLLALLADGQMGLLEGGSLEFALAIERRYRELGGQVTYKATVEEILVEHDQAVVCLPACIPAAMSCRYSASGIGSPFQPFCHKSVKDDIIGTALYMICQSMIIYSVRMLP